MSNIYKMYKNINIEKYSNQAVDCLGEALTYSSALAEEKDPMPLLFPEFQQRLHDNHLA